MFSSPHLLAVVLALHFAIRPVLNCTNFNLHCINRRQITRNKSWIAFLGLVIRKRNMGKLILILVIWDT